MLDTIADAVDDIKKGRMVVVIDEECRENEGDLVMAAEKITADDVNFMAREGRGLICVPISEEYAVNLRLDPMVKDNTERLCTNFTVSVDFKNGTTTGISMSDRAATIKALSDSSSSADQFLKPGHIFPLIAKNNGVLEREGHTEAAVTLAKLGGFSPVGVLCEIIKDDGEMARLPDLRIFADKYGLRMISIRDLVEYVK